MSYVYKITIVPTNQFYFGGKYKKSATPAELGVSYFSSSPVVQNLIFTYGRANCLLEIIQTFDDKSVCRALEERLIKESLDNPLCLNKRNGVKPGTCPTITEERNQKISDNLKSCWANSQFRENRIAAITGRSWKLSQENIDKLPKFTPEMRAAGTEAVRESVWINDGHVTKRIKKDSCIPEGFTKGRLSR